MQGLTLSVVTVIVCIKQACIHTWNIVFENRHVVIFSLQGSRSIGMHSTHSICVAHRFGRTLALDTILR